jgi:thiamine-phosphate diphosphorylase
VSRKETGSEPDPVLHILTSDAVIARTNFVTVAEKVIAALGPRGVFHVRTRQLGGRDAVTLVRQLLPVSRAVGCPVIVNERVDVAMVASAAGVQLGTGALAVRDARKIAPHLTIGLSIHSVAEARETENTRPDWLIAGPIFETSSHPGAVGQGLEFLRAVADATIVPIIAVGGITPARVGQSLAAGAAGIAVISGVWDAPEPERAVVHYFSQYGHGAFRGDDFPHR